MLKGELEEYLNKTMIQVEGGKFMMGEDKKEHEVVLDDFLINKYPVTQELYERVMRKNPSYFKGKERPVERVDWYDTIEFCNKLSDQMNIETYYDINKEKQDPNNESEFDSKKWLVEINKNSKGYRLLTEVEWDYAVIGGQKWKEDHFEYAGGNILNEVGWYRENSHRETKAVGLKVPNQLGLFDMSGNVDEWCWDWYRDYKEDAQKNPRGVESGDSRVVRGGSWSSGYEVSRVAVRDGLNPTGKLISIGFRISMAV
ncbi:MAG: formylglycine-generating enzyme family protein [Flammeovirgaceae bacterium]|nr:formylglycine-generating enzyme family protein [Flammeovirgaceae bacterium]